MMTKRMSIIYTMNKYNIHSIPVQYSTNRAKSTKDKMYNELVITNYTVRKQESLF